MGQSWSSGGDAVGETRSRPLKWFGSSEAPLPSHEAKTNHMQPSNRIWVRFRRNRAVHAAPGEDTQPTSSFDSAPVTPSDSARAQPLSDIQNRIALDRLPRDVLQEMNRAKREVVVPRKTVRTIGTSPVPLRQRSRWDDRRTRDSERTSQQRESNESSPAEDRYLMEIALLREKVTTLKKICRQRDREIKRLEKTFDARCRAVAEDAAVATQRMLQQQRSRYLSELAKRVGDTNDNRR